MKGSIVFALSLLAAACGGDPSLSQQLAGEWVSPSCEAYPGPSSTTYLKRDFSLTDSQWKIDVTVYGDAACTSPFVGLELGGDYKVGQPSAAVSGATEVDYDFSYRKVTPLADAATGMLASCGSGTWTVGLEQDVTASGCAALGIPALAQCPTEHDLNQIQGSDLYYGDRSGDLCTARPTKLGPYPVARK